MKVIIDRFEGDKAVVELPDKSTAFVPKSLLGMAKEGDVISIEVDGTETQKRKERIAGLLDNLWSEK